MDLKRRTFIAKAGSLALLLGVPHISWGATMLAVRMWPSEDYTRVTIESDVPLQTNSHMLSGPDRFVVDIQGMQLNAPLRELSGLVQNGDPYVEAIRVGQFQPDVVRIVFDLKQRIAPNVFTLAPFAEYKDRLVFDFKPVNAPDPLNQLVDEVSSDRAQALDQGDHAEADILGDWLTQQQTGANSTPSAQPSDAHPEEPPLAENPNRRPTPSKVPQTSPSSTPSAQPSDAHPEEPPLAENPNRRPTPSKVAVNGPGAAPSSPTTTAPPPAATSRPERLYIIALDPGHGGEDPGAVGPSGTKEKDVVLAIGKILREQINARRGMRAFMTRDSDYFVPLADRVQKARSVKADLFVSIHADAFTNRSAKGASVFALSEKGASSTTARWLADTQNQSDLIGGVDVKARDRQTASILLSMSTAAQIRDSIKLGKLVIQELQAFAHMHKNNVEQAGFAVLKAPDIPSILVETAFISNPQEEKSLRNPAYQKKLAQAILNAIAKYLAQNSAVASRS